MRFLLSFWRIIVEDLCCSRFPERSLIPFLLQILQVCISLSLSVCGFKCWVSDQSQSFGHEWVWWVRRRFIFFRRNDSLKKNEVAAFPSTTFRRVSMGLWGCEISIEFLEDFLWSYLKRVSVVADFESSKKLNLITRMSFHRCDGTGDHDHV